MGERTEQVKGAAAAPPRNEVILCFADFNFYIICRNKYYHSITNCTWARRPDQSQTASIHRETASSLSLSLCNSVANLYFKNIRIFQQYGSPLNFIIILRMLGFYIYKSW